MKGDTKQIEQIKDKIAGTKRYLRDIATYAYEDPYEDSNYVEQELAELEQALANMQNFVLLYEEQNLFTEEEKSFLLNNPELFTAAKIREHVDYVRQTPDYDLSVLNSEEAERRKSDDMFLNFFADSQNNNDLEPEEDLQNGNGGKSGNSNNSADPNSKENREDDNISEKDRRERIFANLMYAFPVLRDYIDGKTIITDYMVEMEIIDSELSDFSFENNLPEENRLSDSDKEYLKTHAELFSGQSLIEYAEAKIEEKKQLAPGKPNVKYNRNIKEDLYDALIDSGDFLKVWLNGHGGDQIKEDDNGFLLMNDAYNELMGKYDLSNIDNRLRFAELVTDWANIKVGEFAEKFNSAIIQNFNVNDFIGYIAVEQGKNISEYEAKINNYINMPSAGVNADADPTLLNNYKRPEDTRTEVPDPELNLNESLTHLYDVLLATEPEIYRIVYGVAPGRNLMPDFGSLNEVYSASNESKAAQITPEVKDRIRELANRELPAILKKRYSEDVIAVMNEEGLIEHAIERKHSALERYGKIQDDVALYYERLIDSNPDFMKVAYGSDKPVKTAGETMDALRTLTTYQADAKLNSIDLTYKMYKSIKSYMLMPNRSIEKYCDVESFKEYIANKAKANIQEYSDKIIGSAEPQRVQPAVNEPVVIRPAANSQAEPLIDAKPYIKEINRLFKRMTADKSQEAEILKTGYGYLREVNSVISGQGGKGAGANSYKMTVAQFKEYMEPIASCMQSYCEVKAGGNAESSEKILENIKSATTINGLIAWGGTGLAFDDKHVKMVRIAMKLHNGRCVREVANKNLDSIRKLSDQSHFFTAVAEIMNSNTFKSFTKNGDLSEKALNKMMKISGDKFAKKYAAMEAKTVKPVEKAKPAPKKGPGKAPSI